MRRAVLDPHTGQAYRFNPETGQGPVLFLRRIAWWSGNLGMLKLQPGAPRPRNPRREERRIAAAYQREQEADVSSDWHPFGRRSGIIRFRVRRWS